MIVEMGKEYRLANGDAYRMLCTDGGGMTPIIGAYFELKRQVWIAIRHRQDGSHYDDTALNLVEVKPRIKGEFWVVHFLGGPSCKTLQTQQEAQMWARARMWAGASKNAIAITHHTYDCEEGEGLK